MPAPDATGAAALALTSSCMCSDVGGECCLGVPGLPPKACKAGACGATAADRALKCQSLKPREFLPKVGACESFYFYDSTAKKVTEGSRLPKGFDCKLPTVISLNLVADFDRIRVLGAAMEANPSGFPSSENVGGGMNAVNVDVMACNVDKVRETLRDQIQAIRERCGACGDILLSINSHGVSSDVIKKCLPAGTPIKYFPADGGADSQFLTCKEKAGSTDLSFIASGALYAALETELKANKCQFSSVNDSCFSGACKPCTNPLLCSAPPNALSPATSSLYANIGDICTACADYAKAGKLTFQGYKDCFEKRYNKPDASAASTCQELINPRNSYDGWPIPTAGKAGNDAPLLNCGPLLATKCSEESMNGCAGQTVGAKCGGDFAKGAKYNGRGFCKLSLPRQFRKQSPKLADFCHCEAGNEVAPPPRDAGAGNEVAPPPRDAAAPKLDEGEQLDAAPSSDKDER